MARPLLLGSLSLGSTAAVCEPHPEGTGQSPDSPLHLAKPAARADAFGAKSVAPMSARQKRYIRIMLPR